MLAPFSISAAMIDRLTMRATALSVRALPFRGSQERHDPDQTRARDCHLTTAHGKTGSQQQSGPDYPFRPQHCPVGVDRLLRLVSAAPARYRHSSSRSRRTGSLAGLTGRCVRPFVRRACRMMAMMATVSMSLVPQDSVLQDNCRRSVLEPRWSSVPARGTPDPSPDGPSHPPPTGAGPLLASAAAQACHSTQDGTSKFKLPGSPPSFSAWLRSPSSCFPVGERCPGTLSPLLLALPAHRIAGRVLRLDPRLACPLRYGASVRFETMPSKPMLQTCLNTVGPSPVRCSTNWIDRRLALPISFLSRCLRSISGRSRRLSPSCSIRSKSNRRRSRRDQSGPANHQTRDASAAVMPHPIRNAAPITLTHSQYDTNAPSQWPSKRAFMASKTL